MSRARAGKIEARDTFSRVLEKEFPAIWYSEKLKFRTHWVTASNKTHERISILFHFSRRANILAP